eukprot:403358139
MKIASLLTLLFANQVISLDKIGFVYEAVRHGARAPQLDILRGFKVTAGALTASGMRQRYLLGKMQRQRYIDEFKLLDETYNPNQIYIQCTNVNRVMQSSYAELLGFYPPLKKKTSKPRDLESLFLNDLIEMEDFDQQKSHFITEGEMDSLRSGKGMPKLKIRIRNAQESQQNSDSQVTQEDYNLYFQNLRSTIDGLQFIPVFNYLIPDQYDDLNYQGCHYALQNRAKWYSDEKSYQDYSSYILPMMRKQIGQAFNLSKDDIQNMKFTQYYNYSDILRAEDQEGVPSRYNFSKEEWYQVRNSQKILLTGTFSDIGRNLWITKMVQKPIQMLIDTASKILNGITTNDDLKLFVHSAHDTQLLNVIEFFNPFQHETIDQTYCSLLTFELHYDSDCVSTGKKDLTCFRVEVESNGVPLRFKTCMDQNTKNGSHNPYCDLPGFIMHWNSVRYSKGDVLDACKQNFNE